MRQWVLWMGCWLVLPLRKWLLGKVSTILLRIAIQHTHITDGRRFRKSHRVVRIHQSGIRVLKSRVLKEMCPGIRVEVRERPIMVAGHSVKPVIKDDMMLSR